MFTVKLRYENKQRIKYPAGLGIFPFDFRFQVDIAMSYRRVLTIFMNSTHWKKIYFPHPLSTHPVRYVGNSQTLTNDLLRLNEVSSLPNHLEYGILCQQLLKWWRNAKCLKLLKLSWRPLLVEDVFYWLRVVIYGQRWIYFLWEYLGVSCHQQMSEYFKFL